MGIGAAKSVLQTKKDSESNELFEEALKTAVNDGEQVIIAVDVKENGDYMPHMYKGKGQVWAVFYTAPDKVRTNPFPKLVTVDINRVIDIAYSNPHFAGIVIDPESDPVYITRREISGKTERKDPRLAQTDWGAGIPAYTREDVMVIEELMDFAMEVVEEQGLIPGEFEILEENGSSLVFPNYIARKDTQLYFIVVEVAIAPAMAELQEKKKQALLEYARQEGAKCLYASVGIGSKDPERFAKSLALCGDGYMVNFSGFIPVEEE